MEEYNDTTVRRAVARYLSRTGFAAFVPRAALIDMDGTLLDTMSRHTAAWYRLMTELGVNASVTSFTFMRA